MCSTCVSETVPRSSETGGSALRDNILAGIDVGSSKICTLVAEVTPDDDLRVLGVGITPSQGVKKGMVDDIQKATDAISSSVERAERSSGSRIMSAHVSIGGNHTTSLNNRGIATIPGKQRPITEEDIDRAMEGAKSLNLPTNREVLHALARFFVVDGQEQVTDPIGMYGGRLGIDAHIVTGPGTAIQNQVDAEETVEIGAFGGQRTKEVPRRRVAEILQARVEEILEMIYIDIKRAGFDDMIAAGLVLTGGTAELHGIAELSELVLR